MIFLCFWRVWVHGFLISCTCSRVSLNGMILMSYHHTLTHMYTHTHTHTHTHTITHTHTHTQLELPFLEKANAKTEKLRASLLKTTDSQRRYTVSMDMTFIEEAIRELLSSRRILIASYPFGYYVEGGRARRLFENIQVCVYVTSLLCDCILLWYNLSHY